MTSVIELLFETLVDLSNRDLKNFKKAFHNPYLTFKKWHFDIKWRSLKITDIQDTVFLMVKSFGQQSVEKTKDILLKIKRKDLVQRLSSSSSGAKSKTQTSKIIRLFQNTISFS